MDNCKCGCETDNCKCEPGCDCGCNEGKECTCDNDCDCNEGKECTCDNTCKCGSEKKDSFTSDELKKVDEIKKVIEKYKDKKGALIQVLHESQEIYGYLPLRIQKVIAEGLNISVSEIYGVVSFYTQFITEPRGEYKIQVCLGTACYVKGSDKILERVEKVLNIKTGECTPDMKFSLEGVRCIGACGLAPVMSINGEVYGNLKPEMVDEILNKYKQK